jgi:hypothetical protein
MTRLEQNGAVKAIDRDGCVFQFAPEYYDELRTAFLGGKTFFQGRDLYGDELIIRLPGIVGLALITPEGNQRFETDEAELKARETLE